MTDYQTPFVHVCSVVNGTHKYVNVTRFELNVLNCIQDNVWYSGRTIVRADPPVTLKTFVSSVTYHFGAVISISTAKVTGRLLGTAVVDDSIRTKFKSYYDINHSETNVVPKKFLTRHSPTINSPKEQGSFIFVSLKHAVLLCTLSLHQEHVSAMISLELNDSTDWNA